MSYRHKSNLTGDLSEQIAKMHIMSLGWVILVPESRDNIYDLAVQMNGKKIVTVQVKTITKGGTFKTTNRAINSRESVSDGGKPRNCYHYADFGIDWMVGVDIENHLTYFYPLSTYKKYDVINVRKVKPKPFPMNKQIKSHVNTSKNVVLKPRNVLF